MIPAFRACLVDNPTSRLFRPARRDPPGPGRLGTARSGPGLAAGAGVRGPVHEGLATDRGTAAAARFPLPSVDVERPVEVPALPVDVDVERVEAGTPVADRLGQHLPDVPEEPQRRRPGQPAGRPGAVQPGPPERL